MNDWEKNRIRELEADIKDLTDDCNRHISIRNQTIELISKTMFSRPDEGGYRSQYFEIDKTIKSWVENKTKEPIFYKSSYITHKDILKKKKEYVDLIEQLEKDIDQNIDTHKRKYPSANYIQYYTNESHRKNAIKYWIAHVNIIFCSLEIQRKEQELQDIREGGLPFFIKTIRILPIIILLSLSILKVELNLSWISTTIITIIIYLITYSILAQIRDKRDWDEKRNKEVENLKNEKKIYIELLNNLIALSKCEDIQDIVYRLNDELASPVYYDEGEDGGDYDYRD